MDLSNLKELDKSQIGPMYVAFRLGNGADTGYWLTPENAKIYIDESTTARYIVIDGPVELAGFIPSEIFTKNIHDIVPDTGGNGGGGNTGGEVPQPSGLVKLIMLGIDPEHPHKSIEEISDVYIKDNEMKVQDTASKTEIQVCTHTITLGEEAAKAEPDPVTQEKPRGCIDYQITDDEGNTWLSVHQKKTTVQGQFGGEFPNNHPSKVYIKGLTEDSTVYVPLKKNYKIYAKNTGNLPIDFWIMHPWNEEGKPERRILREVIEPKQSATFILDWDKLELDKMEAHKRAIKINFNTIE